MRSELPLQSPTLPDAEANLNRLYDLHKHQNKHVFNSIHSHSAADLPPPNPSMAPMSPLALQVDRKSHYSVMRALWAMLDLAYFQSTSPELISTLESLMEGPAPDSSSHELATTISA